MNCDILEVHPVIIAVLLFSRRRCHRNIRTWVLQFSNCVQINECNELQSAFIASIEKQKKNKRKKRKKKKKWKSELKSRLNSWTSSLVIFHPVYLLRLHVNGAIVNRSRFQYTAAAAMQSIWLPFWFLVEIIVRVNDMDRVTIRPFVFLSETYFAGFVVVVYSIIHGHGSWIINARIYEMHIRILLMHIHTTYYVCSVQRDMRADRCDPI